jgi:hypothetical protein
LKKIQMRAAKLGKLLDGKGEREAHVILGLERGRHSAEMTVNYHNHPLVAVASNPDLSTAIHAALEKMENDPKTRELHQRGFYGETLEDSRALSPARAIAQTPFVRIAGEMLAGDSASNLEE